MNIDYIYEVCLLCNMKMVVDQIFLYFRIDILKFQFNNIQFISKFY